ncbi:glycosyltransferase family 2 protein [Oryzibacter oryziterrae]|uniref:glycosyltransferase family 2 protein n=1 Tax=Oryzibacter oryziterrae TaxID=2766474 RepID=UPI001F21959F|nr:glycosyltransferase family 2 protein [Oryzibacter oryziterrae]
MPNSKAGALLPPDRSFIFQTSGNEKAHVDTGANELLNVHEAGIAKVPSPVTKEHGCLVSKSPLSIFIICQNEADRLPLVLESIKDLEADLVVVDSGSTDGTVDIARRYTDRVFHRAWEGFGPQKVFAEAQCRHDLILNLDADEVLLDEVKASIRAIQALPDDKRAAAYSLRIRHVSLLAPTLKPGLFNPTNITPRLYDRRRAGFKSSTVHDKVITHDGSKPVTLKGDVAHISMKSFSQMWEKIKAYSELSAVDWVSKGRNPSSIRLLFDPPFFFFKNYFIRRLFAVGVEGFVIAIILSAGRALRIGMAKELYERKAKK